MAKQPVTLLENTHDWPRGVQEEVDLIASLDGDDSSISVDDMFMASNALCGSGTSNTLTGKIICDDNDNWTTDALWRAVSKLEYLKRDFSATNRVHWHMDKEAKLVGEDKKKQAYEILKEIKQKYVERLSQTPDISNQNRLKLVYQVLQEMGFIIEPQKNSLFTDNLISKRLDCDTSSFVVSALAEEFGWPVHLIAVPEHTFVRWDNGKEAFNIDYGYIRPNDYYIKEYNVEGDLSKYETPYEASVYVILGVVKETKGDWDGAIAAWKEALKINPRYATAWLNLGVARGVKGDWDGAIEAFNKALEIIPRYANAWEGLGVARGVKGDSNGAIEALKKALEINPINTGVWNNLGVTMQKMGDLDGAEKAFQEARRLDPSLSN